MLFTTDSGASKPAGAAFGNGKDGAFGGSDV